MRNTIAVVSMLTCVAAFGLGGNAFARPIDFDAGHWRLELQGAGAVHSSKTDREGDYFVSGSVEYESPWLQHVAFGIRAYPLFIYPLLLTLYNV